MRKLCKGMARDWKARRREKNGERYFFETINEALTEGHLKPEDCSIRDLFETFVVDSHGDSCGKEVLESWEPQGGGVRLFEATNAVDTSRFSNIFGQIAYTTFIKAYEASDFVMSSLIPTVSSDFEQERIPGVTNLGDVVEEVAEGKPYPRAGVSEEWIDTPRTKKFGVITEIFRETIRFDRTNQVLDRIKQVGLASGYRREKQAIDAVIDQNTTAHRYNYKSQGPTSTFKTSGDWINALNSKPLNDYVSINDMELLFANMIDPYTGEPIMISPKHLIVGLQNKIHATRIVGATQVVTTVPGFATSANPVQATIGNPASGYSLVTSQLINARMAVKSDWIIGDIAEAVKYMENDPLEVTQAAAGSEAEFQRDVVYQIKASRRGAYAVVQPRYLARASA